MGLLLFLLESSLSSFLISYIDTLPVLDGYGLIRQLGDMQRFGMLKQICRSKTIFSSYAAKVTAESVRDNEASRVCAQFKPGSENWRAAFATLAWRPKSTVMPYIKAVYLTGDPVM